jgi:hypothetical protein
MTVDICGTCVRSNAKFLIRSSSTRRIGIKFNTKLGGRCTGKGKTRMVNFSIKASIVIAALKNIS